MKQADISAQIRTLLTDVITSITSIVEVIDSDQWHLPTPCSLWDVSALLNHMIGELVWMPPLLSGQTIEQVGNRFGGDLLGKHPKQAWQAAADQTVAAVGAVDLAAEVQLSAGARTAQQYIDEVFSDLIIHSWDLAKATGFDTTLKPELVEAAWKLLSKAIPAMQASGAYAKPVKVSKSAGRQAKLLAITGRQP